MRRRSVGPSILMITLLVLFAVCLIYPIWLTIEGAFVSYDGGFTLYHIGEVFTNEVLRNSLFNALAIVFGKQKPVLAAVLSRIMG